MISSLISPYSPRYIATLVYMLQSTEYRTRPYLAWYWRTQDFSKVVRRRQLERTRAARLLLVALGLGMALQVIAGIVLIGLWHWHGLTGGWAFGLALIVSYPVVWAHLLILPLVLGRLFIVAPQQRMQVLESERVFKDHSAVKIAIVGSYGKTSMKEILLTILSEGKRVAATPANKNVAISHAQFARTLKGNEEILLIEYGEGAPGDVAKFAKITHPTHAVITGVAPAHLDRYKTVQAAGKDIFSVVDYVPDKHQCYINAESAETKSFMQAEFVRYDRSGTMDWKVSNVAVSLNRLTFTLSRGKCRLQLSSGLVGRHQIGPLALAAALAYEFGVRDEAIVSGVAKTKPFEHRMQPYQLGGAWIIDDTYNGNLEGIRAGTELLRELPAKRKLYITPGLVDQGKESKHIHEEVGRLIAGSGASVIVLMQNSTTEAIKQGLTAANYNGEIRLETDPLNFYTNLEHFVSVGDVVLMQNDWPDNYA
jgi:UDP-N-acetylmuramoyl-tripeptide--D-alanyl-D-alanine ligase